MGRQPRQRPVSCIFCRARKLRCSRQFPCANCTSRGVTCEIEKGGVVPQVVGVGNQTESAGSTGLGGDAVLQLLSRLDKLEKTVQSQHEELKKTREAVFQDESPKGASPRSRRLSSLPQPGTGSRSEDHANASNSSLINGFKPSSRSNGEVPGSAHLQKFTADALWIESGGTSTLAEPLTDQLMTDEIEFRTCPIRHITRQAFFTISTNQPSASGLYPAVKCIWLPLREETRYLTQRYFLDINYFHHIIHMPTLKAKIEKLYDDLDAGRPPQKDVVLLLLSLIANVCFQWSPSEDARCHFIDASVANSQAVSWIKAGMDVTDHVQRLALASIECVQGMAVLFFVTFMMEGFSRRGGHLMSCAINMARNLGLHTIDKTGSGLGRALTQEMSPVQKEIGRRIMWYLAATDWTLGSLTLPQDGSYLVDPRGLYVRKPANVNDEDLLEGFDIVSQPEDVETSASYFLQRIRLAELFRSLNSLQPLSSSESEKAQYDRILEIDARLHQFQSELPPFFSLSFSREATRDLAGAVIRRCTIHLLVRRYLCKIHLPFLARGAVDPAFSYSRRVCLESARIIIRSEAQLSKETLTAMSLRTRMTMVLRCVFLASIALVLDACVADGPQWVQADKPRAEELLETWATLEQAKKVSVVAGNILELSKMVLRKQNPSHPALAGLDEQQELGKFQSRRTDFPATPESGSMRPGIDGQVPTGPPTQIGPDAPVLVDEPWLGLDGNMDVDHIDWERFFWGFDAAPII